MGIKGWEEKNKRAVLSILGRTDMIYVVCRSDNDCFMKRSSFSQVSAGCSVFCSPPPSFYSNVLLLQISAPNVLES